jgi:hypothetical protein
MDTSYAPVSITKTFSEMMKEDIKNKSSLMSKHKKLLNARYNLSEKVDNNVTMSGGKPIPVGPTAKLKDGLSWGSLSKMSPEEIKKSSSFPYLPLPHVSPDGGGLVVSPKQLETHPELVRFDMEFD